MYDDPHTRDQVKLAEAWEALKAWAAAFAEWVQETFNALFEHFRPVIAKLKFWQNVSQNREAAARRATWLVKPSMVRLQKKSPGWCQGFRFTLHSTLHFRDRG